ncbi:AsmA-like C-terminal region-containing protein [Flavobacterium eburneipallidum]|uniref:AsmA-like C-terminal region-containing protein n=1 Tax=Flavobacterium eburneipallidum TaxID=3003263 RepID=UPI0022AC56E9|nr:AsmA-like C-terminal region-containing protein [Flavobacterium eburneipallidum]
MNVAKVKTIVVKATKYIGIGLVVILGLMFLTPIVFSEKLKEEIKKTANKKLAGEMNYSDVDVSFFKHFPSLTLTLNDFKLNGSAPFQKERFINAKEVSFGINLSSLIFGKSINIDEIYLLNSTINIKVTKNGLANYNVYIADKEAPKEIKNGESAAIKLERIEIVNSQLVYDDKSTQVHFDAFGFNYLGKGDLSQDIFDLYSKAKIDKLNILYQNEHYLMNKKVDADLITKININSLSFVFEQNDLMINQLPVDFKGKFDFLKDGYNMDFIINSNNSNLHDLFTAFPPKYITWLSKTEIKGKTDLLLTLKGKYIESKKIAPDLNLDFKIREGFVNYNKSAFPVSNLNLDLSTKLPSLNPDLLIVNTKKLDLTINKDYIKSNFYVKGIQTPEINATFDSKIDLEKLNKALGIPDIELKGTLAAKGTAKGKFDNKNSIFPVTNANISLKNGYIKTEFYPNAITNIKILTTVKNQKGTFKDLKIILKPAELTFEGKPIFITANLSDFDDLTYDIKAKGILNISRIYKVFSQKGLDVDGSIKANLVLKGKQSDAEKGNYSKLHNKGILELRNILIATEYLPKKFLIKEGIFKINQDKMSFNNFLAAYGQSDFRMNGYLQNVFNFVTTNKGILRGSFTLNSNYINADEFMSQTQVNTTNPTTANSETKPTSPTTGVIIIPNNLDLHFQANAQKVNFNELTLNQAKGTMSMKKGKLTMQNTGFNRIGCAVTMDANYHATTPETAFFDYAIKANDFDIKKAYNEIKTFREMASAAEKAQGIIALEYKLKGRLNANMEPIYPSLVGNGIVSVKDIKMYGMKMFNIVAKKTGKGEMKNPELSKVQIKSSIKNNIITLERFKFKFAGFRPRIEGTTSLDGRLNIKMRLGLPPLGILGIPMIITGNKDNPKVKIGRKSEDLEETKDSIQ